MPKRPRLRFQELSLFAVPVLLLGGLYLLVNLRLPSVGDGNAPTLNKFAKPLPPDLWHMPNNAGPLLVSPDGHTMYTLGDTGGPNLIGAWTIASGLMRRSFDPATALDPDGLALSDDGTRLAYTADGTRFKRGAGIYQALSGTLLRTLPPASGDGAARFMPGTHTLFVGRDGEFTLWDTDRAQLLRRVAWREPRATANWLLSPTFSPDGKRLAVLRSARAAGIAYANGARDEIGVFSTRSGRRLRAFGWPATSLEAVAFIGDGRQLIVRATTWRWVKRPGGVNTVQGSSQLRLLPWRGGPQRLIAQATDLGRRGVTVSPSGRWFAFYSHVAKGSAMLVVHDAFTLRRIGSLQLPGAGHEQLAFAPDGSALYYCSGTLGKWPRDAWELNRSVE